MHFGKIVKNVAYSSGFSAVEFSYLMEMTEIELLRMYEQKEWTSGNILKASRILKHDFGCYFNQVFKFNFMPENSAAEPEEMCITVRYPKGKEVLLKTWLNKMALIAKAIGLSMTS